MATYNGIGKKITAKQKKATIMAANNWTAEQYRKQYDIFKNKLRFYENIQKSRGIADYMDGGKYARQSPQDFLYRIAKAKIHYGEDYEPSQAVQEITALSAYSIKAGERIAQKASGESYKSAVRKIVNIRFDGFIDFYDKAAEIVERIDNPVKQEEALKDFAAYLHSKFPRAGKDKGGAKKSNGNIPVSSVETYGSDFNMSAEMGSEFDINIYL